MRAMLLRNTAVLKDNPIPLELVIVPDPVPAANEVLIRVHACGVCHTELDEIEGRITLPVLPAILGHQVVGRVEVVGEKVKTPKVGERVGVAWIYSACGHCEFCRGGEENLCNKYRATGRDAHGGYAEFMTVPAAFTYRIPDGFTDAEAAPLLCAGAIGYRSLRLTNLQNGQKLGLTGFGASGHLVLKFVRHYYPDTPLFIFARDEKERAFALELGASWAGDTADNSPEKLHAIIDTTPAWFPVVHALGNLLPGGRLVINAIHKDGHDKKALLTLDYPKHLWQEKEIKSVANITRADVRDFLHLAAKIPLKPEVQEYALKDANQALFDMQGKTIRGAKVLRLV